LRIGPRSATLGDVSALDRIKAWLGRAETAVKEESHGARPATTSPPGEPDRETSTDAQVEGAVGQPWPGDED
jgi:hypothetical protein